MKQLCFLFLGFLAGTFASGQAPSPAAAPPSLAIQPLGAMDAEVLAQVRERLEQTFTLAVVTLPAAPLPAAAFYPPRNRYRGTRLLDWLSAHPGAGHRVVLGVTAKDISVTKVAWMLF